MLLLPLKLPGCYRSYSARTQTFAGGRLLLLPLNMIWSWLLPRRMFICVRAHIRTHTCIRTHVMMFLSLSFCCYYCCCCWCCFRSPILSTAAAIAAAGVSGGAVASGGVVAVDGASIADDAFVFYAIGVATTTAVAAG